MAANTATATFTVTAVDDSADDDDETAVFTVATGNGYTPASGSAAIATVTITDDDADTTPPSPVTGIAATPGNGQVVLSWTNPAATDLAMVMISATAGGLTVDLNGGGTTGNDLSIAATASSTGTSTITSLTNGTEYTFSIVALDGTGNPSTAATIMATPAIPTPQFSFPTATATAAEGGGVSVNIAFTGGALTTGVTLSANVGGTATVTADYTTNNASAIVDLAGGNGAIEILAGRTSPVEFLIFTPADADGAEGDETLIITLLDGDGYTVGSANTYTLTITDVAPPPPVASIYIGAVGTQTGTITEAGTGSTTVTVTLSSAPTTATTVNLTRTGDATIATDYSQSGLTPNTDPAYSIMIAEGATTATFMLTAVDDSADDDAETAVFTVVAGTGYTPASGSAAVATVTITDDDADTTPPSPVTGIAATPGDAQVVLSWTNPAATDLAMVMISATAGGTAVDLNGGGTTGNDLSIAATASSTGTSTITSLTNGTEYTFSIVALDGTGNPSTAVTIMATPAIPPPQFSFPTATATVAEGGIASVSIAFTGGAPLTTGVNLSVSVGGTAVAADYRTGTSTANADLANGSIRINAGRTSPVSFAIATTADTLAEVDETLIIMLLTGDGYTVGSANTYTLTITDVAPADTTPPSPVTGIAATPGNGQVVLSWTNPAATDLAMVMISATAGGLTVDLNGGGTTGNDLSIAATASSTGTSTITSLTNGTEYTFSIVALDGTGNPSTAATIMATPAISTPEVSFTTATATVAEGGGVNVRIAFTGGALADVLRVSVSVSGTAVAADYRANNSTTIVTLTGATPTISILAGRPSPVLFAIFTTRDTLTEDDETLIITLLDGDGYTVGSANTYTLTITNVAPVASIYIGATGTQVGTITEAGTSATTVTVELAAAAPAGGLPVNLMRSGDATIATDYSQSGLTPNTDPAYSIMIAEGATTATFMLTAVDDSADDDAETAIFTIATGTGYTPASGAAAVATVTITDDDAPADTTPPSPVTGIAATPGDAQVVLSWTNPAATDLAMVMISATAGGAAVDLNGGGTTGNDLSIAATASSTGTSTITSLTNGTEYTFSIVALDGTGNPSTAATAMATPAMPPPEVSFTTATATLAEGSGNALVRIAFTGGALTTAVDVSVRVGGTAGAADYTTFNSTTIVTLTGATPTIRIRAGFTSTVAFAISATTDVLTEGSETLIITLLDGDGYTVGSANTYTLTITDPPPVASIYIGVAGTQTGTITEAGTSATTVTVELAAAAPAGGLPVNLMRSGDATIATDYSQSGLTPNTDPAYTLTVPANMTTATFILTAVDDSADDDDETAVFTVATGTGYTPASGSAAVVTVTITDDDADTTPPSPVTGIAATPGDAQVVLSWTNPAATDLAMVMISATAGGLTVDLNGGGTTGNDLSIAATASSTGTSTITSLTNGTEYTFSIVALDGTGNPSTAATIMATPAIPQQFSFQTATATVAEGGSVVVNIAFTGGTLSGDTFLNVSVGGTAVAADYTTGTGIIGTTTVTLTGDNGTIKLCCGDTTPGQFIILTTADTLTEGDETVLITLLDGDGYTVGSANTYTLTITNVAPRPPPEFSFQTATATVAESGSVNVNIAFTGGALPTGGVTLSVSVGGTATVTADYTAANSTANVTLTGDNGTIKLFGGDTTPGQFIIFTTADTLTEGDETVTITLLDGDGYTVGSANTYTLTITDPPPVASIYIGATGTQTGTITEVGTSATTVTVEFAAAAPVGGLTVNLMRSGGATIATDYSQSGLTPNTDPAYSIMIAEGATTATFMLTAVVDTEDDDAETAVFTIATGMGYAVASGGAEAVTVTITDDDIPPSPVTGIAATPGNGQVVLSWTNPAATDLAMVMISATAGGTAVDLNGGGTTGNDLSIAATASSTGTSTITSLTNGTEYTFSIVALDGTGNPSTAATIMATPAIPPEFSFTTATATVAEGVGFAAGSIAFTGGALTTAVDVSVSVGGTAVAADYTATDPVNVRLTGATPTIRISAGSMSPFAIFILITTDTLTEGSETLTITLLDGDGYTVGSANTYTLTITD